jgi:hypothetical protein
MNLWSQNGIREASRCQYDHMVPFSQRGCTVAAYRAGGALVAGRRKNGCLVQVVDGTLVLQNESGVIDEAPVPAVTIATPRVQRALGGATFVHMNDHNWSIDFGFAYQAEKTGGTSTLGLMLGGTVKSMKFARKRNREFLAALLQGGAATR